MQATNHNIASHDIGKFDYISQSWMKSKNVDSNDLSNINAIKLLTYNVWFSDEYIEERAEALFKILNESDADIIALQEVTYHFLQLILMQDWIRKDYFISDFKGDTFGSYGVLLLSRFSIKELSLHQLATHMERQLLLAEFVINDQSFKVATVHLESMKDSVDIRAEQLEAIFPLLASADNSVLMGDFNFCSSNKVESANINDDYIDLWSELKPNEFGATLNSEINKMLIQNSSSKIMSRYDKILFQQKKAVWYCKDIHLIGDTAISDYQPNIFPSDHFGLLAQIEC